MTEQQIPREDLIYHSAAKVLRYGFLISAVTLVLGAAWSIVDRHPLSTDVLPFQDIPGALADGNPSSLIDLGILLMMLTPVATVLVIAVDFFRLGERKFVTLSLGVLAILITSIVISLLK